MLHSIANILFSDYRRRVLGLLLLWPEQSYHVREIARLTGTAAGTLHKELARLAEAGLLSREKIGNQMHYRANRQCPVFEDLANILRKTSGMADVLRHALAGVADRLAVAFVFGSVARGEERTASDIDVMLIGDLGFAEGVKALHPAQGTLGREISLAVYSAAEFRRKYKAGDPFLREVMAGKKLFLIGNDHDLGKFAGSSSPGRV